MTAFATLENYIVAYGELADGPANEKVQQALDAACAQIRTHCSQVFDLTEGDEIEVYGTGRATLLLPELPIVAVNSVFVDKGLASETEVLDFRIDKQNGVLFRPSGSSTCWSGYWPSGFLNITVNYDHGYEEIPADLINAAVWFAHEKVSAGSSRLTGETIAGYGYTQTAGKVSLKELADVLEPYRAKRIPVP